MNEKYVELEREREKRIERAGLRERRKAKKERNRGSHLSYEQLQPTLSHSFEVKLKKITLGQEREPR